MWYNFGSLTIPGSWIALLVTFLIIGLLLKFIARDSSFQDLYANAVFLFLITWKFSVILFDFKNVIAYPLSILYFNGGMKGYWLAIIVVIIYLCMKGKWEEDRLYLIFTCGLIIYLYEGFSSILNQDFTVVAIIQTAINSVFILLSWKKLREGRLLTQFIVLLIFFQFLIFSMKGTLTSITALTYVVFLVIIIFVYKREGNG
ncbi:hypothetical protein J2S13_001288 [Oikeobacillus pervagus]|uniref:Uncharacterized protein n=1 Tax=Oikeobacillus pervagus TaxID=1325931 RepID=A0AAJ1SYJ5_9BACI|nr:hypothetical protein [Oikeobacillus pervagus]MDQ0214889.1 hypothetical protein [Oikeobacillus pervagus]